MVIRYIIYLARTWQDYLNLSNQNIYGSTKVKLPTPEFYMIYMGNDKSNCSEWIDLSSFFSYPDTKFLEAKVRVICDETYKTGIIQEHIT